MIKILTIEEYREMFPVPNSPVETTQASTIEMWIEDATNSIDDLCGGKVFKEFPTLDGVVDANRIYKLKRAIGSTTLLLDQTNKMFYDSSTSAGGNVPFSLNSKSGNSSVEYKRQDIIKTLIQGGWYTNTYFGGLGANKTIKGNEEFEKLILALTPFFLKVDGSNNYEDNNLTFPSGTNLIGTQNIEGRDVTNINTGKLIKPLLLNYDLRGIEDIASLTTKKILDPIDNLYKFINENDVNYFGGLTKDQIDFRITASNVLWNEEFSYKKDYVVQFIDSANQYKFANSLIDNNIGNDPNTSPDAWNILNNPAIDIDQLITQLTPIIVEEVDKAVDNIPSLTLGGGLEVVGDILQVDNTIATTTQLNEEITQVETSIQGNREIINANIDIIEQNKVDIIANKNTINANLNVEGIRTKFLGSATLTLRPNSKGEFSGVAFSTHMFQYCSYTPSDGKSMVIMGAGRANVFKVWQISESGTPSYIPTTTNCVFTKWEYQTPLIRETTKGDK